MLIKRCGHKDVDGIIEQIKRSNHNDRSLISWHKNNMSAVLALQRNELVGSIPFEQVYLRQYGRPPCRALWISGAYVEEKFRSQGYGTAMDRALERYFPCADIVLAIPPPEGSAGYRWYMNNQYFCVSKIISLKKEVLGSPEKSNYLVYKNSLEAKQVGTALLCCFNKWNQGFSGFPERYPEFWSNKFEYHYYKKHYKYFILAIHVDGKLEGYVFIGRTSIRDGIERLDILEIGTNNLKVGINELLTCVYNFAIRDGVLEIRFQCLASDPFLSQIQQLGFVKRWETSLVAKNLHSRRGKEESQWRFFQVDYI
jgi:hypothetical protein